MEEHGNFHHAVGLGLEGNERRLNLTSGKSGSLGFNIRGGGEYGLGIYVSKSVSVISFILVILAYGLAALSFKN